MSDLSKVADSLVALLQQMEPGTSVTVTISGNIGQTAPAPSPSPAPAPTNLGGSPFGG